MRVVFLFLAAALSAVSQNGQIQKPGEIQQPKGNWQKPGAIQVPKGIQAIRAIDATPCERRLVVGADALFDFDQSVLSPDAKKTLTALGPLIQKAGKHPIVIEGHTDAVGSDAYNQDLSERRAKAVRAWLIEQHLSEETAARVEGFGRKRPVAPNAKPDGSDDPEGRQKNRRVEVVIDTCK
ncbi:MAG TPA: OmpA family protein [Bryobacteraceae bacterium]|nr:OmpA family protein [Bryobacteraceae bacterium]